MEPWRRVWREGIFPEISTPGLEVCLRGLEANDNRIIQGKTSIPAPLPCVQEWPVEAADLIGYSFWQGDAKGEAKVIEVEEFFAKICFEADNRIGEPACCRWYLNWYDDSPRDEMIREMIPELKRAIQYRKEEALVAQGEAEEARRQIRYEESQSERSR